MFRRAAARPRPQLWLLVAAIAMFNTTFGLLFPVDNDLSYLFAAISAVLLVIALVRAYIDRRRAAAAM